MLEIACFNANSAIAAANAGADRIELCADYAAGGLTPSQQTLDEILQKTAAKSPVNVMIRPRPGSFTYSDSEIDSMKSSIEAFKSTGAAGFVFGIVNSDGCVDEERNGALVQAAAPLPCTFHRAFDGVEDMEEAIEVLIRCGFKAVLTSGCRGNAVGGAEKVAVLHERFGSKIDFILGGGIRTENLRVLRRESKVRWFHSAAITKAGEDVDEEEVARLGNLLRETG